MFFRALITSLCFMLLLVIGRMRAMFPFFDYNIGFHANREYSRRAVFLIVRLFSINENLI